MVQIFVCKVHRSLELNVAEYLISGQSSEVTILSAYNRPALQTLGCNMSQVNHKLSRYRRTANPSFESDKTVNGFV
jgi:hypothetical protein